MRSSTLFGAFALGAALVACGMSSELSSLGDGAGSRRPDGPNENASDESPSGGLGAAPELGPTDNGVIMVHAAGAPAFRLCFENELDRQPQPDSQAMPQANVVGVEIGSAVRIAPLRGAPGKLWMFEEPIIRSSTMHKQTCKDLLDGQLGDTARELTANTGPVLTDLSRGVHLLVVAGCAKDTALTKRSKAECGDDWEPATGNLHLVQQELLGAKRAPGELPAQVIHLARPLESARGGATLEVSFGVVKPPGAAHTSIASGPSLFGAPLDLAAPPQFTETHESIYDEVGFRVTLKDGTEPATVVAQQSLADVQQLSAPRDIPTAYYAAASNYVLLLLGNPDPKLTDGGADDDPLRQVHLLAVPVIDTKAADAGVDGDVDAGAAPDGSQ